MSGTMEQDAGTTAPASTATGTSLVRADDVATGSLDVFASSTNYEAAKRMATALSQSTIVPEAYRGTNGVANCLVALELAGRTRASVMMVMQNVHVIKGKPGWSAAFLIASVNSCGRFSPLRYQIEGGDDATKDTFKCRAVARDLASGETLEGEWITWQMVNAEGWKNKDGSKWKTMPGQMFRYRAAAFWVRAYAPEISLGMHTADEIEDFSTTGVDRTSTGARDLNAALRPGAIVTVTNEPAANETTVEAEILADDRELLRAEGEG